MKNWFKKKLSIVAVLVIITGSVFAEAINIAYQPINGPLLTVIEDKKIEEASGAKIKWREFKSGGTAIAALASGAVVIAVAGSSPAATIISKGEDVELFYILDDIGAAEALVARNGSGVNSVKDLVGKKVAVPFASTTHFHLIFALEQNKVDITKVKILDMEPQDMVPAWKTNRIDAAFVWDPALGTIQETGKIIVTSGELSALGKATFDGILVNKSWGKKNKKFVVAFIRELDKANKAYLANPSAWSANSAEVKKIAKRSGSKPEAVPSVLEKLHFLTLKEQLSKDWLGGGRKGGAVKALTETSKFLKEQGKIKEVLSDYSKSVNSSYAKAAR